MQRFATVLTCNSSCSCTRCILNYQNRKNYLTRSINFRPKFKISEFWENTPCFKQNCNNNNIYLLNNTFWQEKKKVLLIGNSRRLKLWKIRSNSNFSLRGVKDSAQARSGILIILRVTCITKRTIFGWEKLGWKLFSFCLYLTWLVL